MDFTPFRQSQELSDVEITLKPDDHRYNLHKFPLYTKSEFIRDLVTQDPNLRSVTLDNFPGGTENFERIADFCYSHLTDITKDNVVNLACAARFLGMQGHGNLVELTDRYIGDLLTSAKLTRSVGIIVGLLVQCDTEDEAKQNIRDKCIDTIIEIWSKPPSRFPYKRDQGPNIQDLSLDIVKKIIQEGKKANIRGEVLFNVIREYTERYLRKESDISKPNDTPDLKLNLPEDILSDDEDAEIKAINGKKTMEDDHHSSDSDENEAEREQPENEKADPIKNDEAPEDETSQADEERTADPAEDGNDGPDRPDHTADTEQTTPAEHVGEANETEEEKEQRENDFAEKLNPLVMELPDKARTLRDDNNIRWVVQALEVANRKECECRDRLLYAASTVLAQIPEKELRTMTPDLVCDLLNEAGRSGFHFANTICVITDFYILDKAKEGTLDKDTFIKLAQALPDGFRTNLDTLYEAYGIMSKDCSQEERDVILNALDLSRLSEDAMAKAYDNESIPADLIVPALITRCKRLKGDLEKAKEVIKNKESEQYRIAKSRQYSSYPTSDTVFKKPNSQVAWPLSAREHRYDTFAGYDNGSLPTSPRHKPITVKPVARKPGAPLSARYHNEMSSWSKQTSQSSSKTAVKFGPVNVNTGSASLPNTPRSAWRNPQKATSFLPPDTLLPDYSSSGIGPDDARQILYELSLTSPRLSYMYTTRTEVPERDLSSSYSPRRSKKH